MPRLLLTPTHSAAPPPPEPIQVDSDVVVILAALLCALICVVGLSLVARCAWLRRSISASPPPPPNKGLKKKVLQSFPKLAFDGSPAATGGVRLVECVICLAEFVEGDMIRILPQCGHGFHVGCVDTWLGSHSSCPSCRRVPVVVTPASRCSSCGAAAESDAKAREDGDDLEEVLGAWSQLANKSKFRVSDCVDYSNQKVCFEARRRTRCHQRSLKILVWRCSRRRLKNWRIWLPSCWKSPSTVHHNRRRS